MPSIIYNKLVRDRIPDIIAESGKQPVVEILDMKSYKAFLDAKLAEELKEYILSDSVEELADMAEVIIAILEYKSVSHDEFDEIRNDKNNKRGKFERRLLLKEVISE